MLQVGHYPCSTSSACRNAWIRTNKLCFTLFSTVYLAYLYLHHVPGLFIHISLQSYKGRTSSKKAFCCIKKKYIYCKANENCWLHSTSGFLLMPRVLWMCVLLPNLYALLAINEPLILLNLGPAFAGVWGLRVIAQFCLISTQLYIAIKVILMSA